MSRTKVSKIITTEELRAVLDYDTNTGVFTWKETRGSNAIKGSIAGCLSRQSGYHDIKVGGTSYRAHRLAWQYVYGYVPELLDHIDRNKLNNAIANLRVATRSENTLNSKVRSDNTTGKKGITLNKHGSWIANLSYNGNILYLGSFKSIEEAVHARDVKVKELGVLC